MSSEQPKLVSDCATLYARMEAEADEYHVWRGKIVDSCLTIGIALGSYSRVVNALRKLGCIDLIEQGYRGRPTVYRLAYPPTEAVWRERAPERTEDLTSAPSLDILSGQFDDLVDMLETRLGGLNIVEALGELEKRIDDLQQQVQSLTATQQQKQSNT